MSYRARNSRGGRDERRRDLRKAVLAVGFLGIAVGTLAAWNAPATGYEISIYRATPTAFWAGALVAFAAAGAVCVMNPRDRLSGIGVLLGWLTTVLISGLPAVRSYRFHGSGDPMTHLGWAVDLRTGRLSFGDLFYPGGHGSAGLLAEAAGLETARAMLLFVAVLVGVYVLFVPLTVRALVDTPGAAVIAAFSGFMLLAFNNVSTRLMFHTYSLGVMFLPVVLYLLVRFLRSDREGLSTVDRLGGLNGTLLCVCLASLLIHPQVNLNVVILIGTIAVVHRLYTRRAPDHPMAAVRPLTGVVAVTAVCWAVWSLGHWQVFVAGSNVLDSAYGTVFGTQVAGQAVAETGDSAEGVGAGLPELFAKLFLVPAVYSAAALGAVAYSFLTLRDGSPDGGRSVVTYFGYAGLVLGPFFLLHFLGDVSEYFFRHLGFAVTLVTVIGAVGLHAAGDLLPRDWRSIARPIAVVVLVVALVVSLVAVFPSPYIYLPSSHVSDQEVNGYQNAIEYRDGAVQWSGIRSGPGRQFDALSPGERPPAANGNSTYTDAELRLQLDSPPGDLYFGVTARDVQRETIAYREFRYSRASLEALGSEPGLHHVRDNGGFDLYYLESGIATDGNGSEDGEGGDTGLDSGGTEAGGGDAETGGNVSDAAGDAAGITGVSSGSSRLSGAYTLRRGR
ncbi:hypothetical protein [Halorubrum lipolyticum]|uniref:Glycosyltransferase RgtA/B/C/D-like domain-containing protein n=1 Tax=Halorubrum lipolyticum DSM 21995 TaxID=1227482 RepID=M0P0J8_9EURY|nr:hypothetical protein [Halorubrum lipolyticum]EMA63702.1 hypothetical protein C469_02566 [Halorubrum lipolyticum DSM 21995]